MAKKVAFVSVVVCLLVSVAAVPTAQAQFAENTGTIQGTLKDPSGAVVPGAKVVLSGEAVAAGRTATTDNNGFFRFAELQPGIYGFTVTATGFQKYVESGIRVDVGKRITLDIELKVGEVTQVVEVTAGAAQIDVTSSKAMMDVTFDRIDVAPKPRGFLALMEWAPGARNEPALGGFQIDGASSSENTYAIQGQDTTSIFDGSAGVNPPTDFFREVSVKSSGYEAEHSGAMGGVVQAVIKSGGSNWHGAGILYYRQSGLDSHPHYFVRHDPNAKLCDSCPTARFSEPVQTYNQVKDRYRIFDPGFELGGPVWKDRVFLYTSYIPDLNRNSRTVNITSKSAPGPRTFTQTDNTHFGVARVDGTITKSLHANAAWETAYRRTEGTDRPAADSVQGLTNTGAQTDPGKRRPDRGQVFPNNLWRVGADWMPTSKLVITGGAGRWFTDTEDRGVPTGIRHLFQSSSVGLIGLNGTPVPTQFQFGLFFSDIPNNRQQLFDKFARTQGNVDASYIFRLLGSHTVKGGFTLDRLSDDILLRNSTALVDLFWGQTHSITAPFAAGCAAANTANGGNGCRGNYGWYQVRDFQRRGAVSSDNKGLYIQDSWNVGKIRGLTINAGVRFDKEFLPSFTPTSLNPNVVTQPILFSYGDKVAPRIGAAYDVLHNGKLKVYGSWGWFYDIMKYSLPRGSFGGDYWHNCAFTLDTFDFNTILPGVKAGNFTCNNGTTGQTPGILLGEEDLRIPSNIKDPTCPAATPLCHLIDPALQPVRQTEFTLGTEWAFNPNMSFEVRWAHKLLRNTIEDEGILGPSGEQFLIVNPGERIGQFPLRGDCAVPGDPRCVNPLGIPTLPAMPKAVRKYDGVEFRFSKRFTGNWYLNASYTWSRLFGNYSGLANSDEDAAQQFSDPFGVGRAEPNVSREFDEQEIEYNASGRPEFGPLQTDRPHTFKAFGGYRIKWWGMSTTLGVNQQWYIGTPRGTRIQFSDIDISVFAFGRGNLANISQDSAGTWILNSLTRDAREPVFTNTDLSITHEFKLSKTNEALRLGLNFTALNLFNQAQIITHKDRTDRDRFDGKSLIVFPDPTCGDPQGCASVSTQFRKFFFDGFDVIKAVNDPNNVDGLTGLRLDSLYQKPLRIGPARTLRLMLKVTF